MGCPQTLRMANFSYGDHLLATRRPLRPFLAGASRFALPPERPKKCRSSSVRNCRALQNESLTTMTANRVETHSETEGRHHNAPTPLLSRDQVVEALQKNRHAKTETYRAFYSSIVGGITRDPSAMVVPIDDHMVHRGHAVFDTAIIRRGQLYELEEHLDRFLTSASNAKIRVDLTREEIRSIIISTAAASRLKEGFMRYWLSTGPGGFAISPAECASSSFYVIAVSDKQAEVMSTGIRMITAKTPMKSAMMSTTKTVNYIPNALVHMEAVEAGVEEALWIDERGNIAEGPTMNVAFVSQDGYLLVPSFDRILAGCTMKRVLKLAEQLVQSENVSSTPLLTGIKFGSVPETEARQASEMFLVGSATQVKPVIQWDGVKVGEGTPGPVAKALYSLLLEAYLSSSQSPIPDLY